MRLGVPGLQAHNECDAEAVLQLRKGEKVMNYDPTSEELQARELARMGGLVADLRKEVATLTARAEKAEAELAIAIESAKYSRDEIDYQKKGHNTALIERDELKARLARVVEKLHDLQEAMFGYVHTDDFGNSSCVRDLLLAIAKGQE